MADYNLSDKESRLILDTVIALKHSGFGSITIKIANSQVVDMTSEYHEDHATLKNLYLKPS